MNDRTRPVLGTGIRTLAGTLLMGAALALAVPAALAQEAEAPAPEVTLDTVVATVGGETITEADIAFAAEDLQQELAQMPPQQRRAFLVTVLIDMKVMADAARSQGMADSAVFQRRLAYLEERALRRAYFAEAIATGVTPEAVQAAYDEMVATFEPRQEIRASHVLVETEEDAEAIRAELEAGASFAELAQEKSIDPSAQQNGGDLGFFGRGMMVQPFEEAAFALEPGEISEPVQSNFGWHVIRLEETRQSTPPPLEQVRPQLQQQVMFETFEASLNALKADIEIEIPDPELAAGVAAQQQGQPAAE